MATKEEDFAVGRSSKSDAKFDTIIGYIEDIIMEDEFQLIQNKFMDKYYLEFEDSEENKLSYTEIHKEYTELIERYIVEKLTQKMTDFSMDDFQKQLLSRKNELEGEVFEMLVTFSDFLAFKEIMLDYRADKEGRTVDLSTGFTVTSLGATNNGNMLGIGGVGLSIGGSGLNAGASGFGVPSGHQVNLMDAEEDMVEGGNTPRLGCGEPMHEGGSTTQVDSIIASSSTDSSKVDSMDATMESPRQ